MSRSLSLLCLKVSQLSWTKGKCTFRMAHLFPLHEIGVFVIALLDRRVPCAAQA